MLSVNLESFQKPAVEQSDSLPISVVLTGTRSAFIGSKLISRPFRTAVPTIFIGLDADVSLRISEKEKYCVFRQPLLVVKPGMSCELEVEGGVAVLFCDALKDDLTKIDFKNMRHNMLGLRELLKKGPKKQSPENFIEIVFGKIGIENTKKARPEIVRVVSALGREPEKFENVEIAASYTGMSSMRFQHIFTETLGMPFRRYRQWRRMGAIVRSLAIGKNLTEAAYDCGFSSSAHLSTAFKEMFGLRPSEVFSNKVDYFLSDLYEKN